MYKHTLKWEFYGYRIIFFIMKGRLSMKKSINNTSIHQKKLLDDIKKTRQALDTVYCNFQYVSDPDLIDCYIYEMNSVHLRYKYLLKQLQKLNSSEKIVV